MKKLQSHLVGIDQGEVVLFDFEQDGEMWTGDGPRKFSKRVDFSESYAHPPNVTAHLSMWDVSNSGNMRTDVEAVDIETTGFSILFRTWGDTQVARVRVAWMSIGALTDDDVWDL